MFNFSPFQLREIVLEIIIKSIFQQIYVDTSFREY